MLEAIASVHYEQRAFQVEQERVAALKLLGERDANTVALGEHFIRAREHLCRKDYVGYVKSLGLIPLTAEGFILQANRANGTTPAPYIGGSRKPKRNPEAEVLKELIALAERIGPEAAIRRAKELLDG